MRPITSFGSYALGIVMAASVLTSCKKDKQATEDQPIVSGNGYGNISYYASALGTIKKTGSSGLKTNAMGDTSVVVDWVSATVYVEKITFTGQNKNTLDTTIMVDKNLNIFNNALAGIINLPAGSYKNAKLKLYCRKSQKSELAFYFKGAFTNLKGTRDSLLLSSSFPFEADVNVADMPIGSADHYKATFNFDLSKILKGIDNKMLESGARTYNRTDGKKGYVIWKGGSADEPFYDQVIKNWQSVTSVNVTKGVGF